MTEIDRLEPMTAAWSSVMAALYDPFLWLGEIAGMRHRRRLLLSEVRGVVVEIGAGTGLNVALYPDGDVVDELVLTEPDPGMRAKLAGRLDRTGRTARVYDAPAERLPFADATVDTVVATLVLCTVPDPERALREIARVLRSDGQLLFIEHVRAHSRFLAALQDRLVKPWRGFASGCMCNRSTLDLCEPAASPSRPTKACGVRCRRSCIRSSLGGQSGPDDVQRHSYSRARLGDRQVQLRTILQSAFTPGRIVLLKSMIRGTTTSLFDSLWRTRPALIDADVVTGLLPPFYRCPARRFVAR